jgi:organic radical activating enzyme
MVAQINAQSDAMVQQMKNHTEMTTAQLKEQAQDIRTWFEENMTMQSEREERIVRLVSEQTERMQEMRLENARAAGAASSAKPSAPVRVNVDTKGIDDTKKAVASAMELAKATADAVDEMKKKPKKRKIKAPSGKTYEVEDV